MKITALAIVAAIAVANVAAADQPALRAAASPVETATTAEKSGDGNKKKEFWGWGGPWGGYGWGGRWGGGWGGCCGLGGWGGWGW
ncbi:hypothetical protein P3T76_003992 [Phytophthora citrophthora]|uniref:Uncharacterized protein n=1 Tax=Phytophthora citrophthora TaxID=4793 RepID=A0AAD9GSP0_9STRA|nr:hypothetical protein P3T76_003992 [Phytophthora citrophthora]